MDDVTGRDELGPTGCGSGRRCHRTWRT